MRCSTRSIMVAALLIWATSCGDFGNINVDPNSPLLVAPETLLTSSLRSIGEDLLNHRPALLYVQMVTETRFTRESRYSTIPFNFNLWYFGPLANLQRIIELNTDASTKILNIVTDSGSNAHQIAVARILKAYFFHTMTDQWGPIPYSEALQGRENFRPAYDSQEFIYKDLLKELKEAAEQTDEDGDGVRGDFLFGGDMGEWKKFANSLRVIIALRMSEVDSVTAQSEFELAVNAPGGLIDADVMYPYLAESANENPWYPGAWWQWAVTTTLVENMKPFDDPRLDRYADRAGNDEVMGMPFGIDIISAGNIPWDSISFLGSPAVRGQDAPIAIMTRSQMLFSQSEAILRGWMDGDARTMYEDAIMASWKQWDVWDVDAFQEFIVQEGVAWDEDRAMERIMTQKWVALFPQGIEAWSEWRRTGWPKLTPGPAAIGDIPVRLGYPLSEPLLNTENYEYARDILLGGEDDLNTRLWWDTE